MAEKKIKCKDCGKQFLTNPNARYPRKYCDKCSNDRKKAYENISEITIDECED